MDLGRDGWDNGRMSADTWTADDERARGVYEARLWMRAHLGINTDGLTDDEVVLILQRRVTAFVEKMKPTLERLRDAELLQAADAR